MNADLQQMIATIDGIRAGMAETREKNRRDFPLATSAMDSLRRDFNDGMPPFNARVINAEECGRKIGKRE